MFNYINKQLNLISNDFFINQCFPYIQCYFYMTQSSIFNINLTFKNLKILNYAFSSLLYTEKTPHAIIEKPHMYP